MQLCRTSLAEPSQGSSVGKQVTPEEISSRGSHFPDVIIAHSKDPDPAGHRTRLSFPATGDPCPRSSTESIPMGHCKRSSRVTKGDYFFAFRGSSAGFK